MRPIKNCFNKQLAELCKRSIQLEELSDKVKQLLPSSLAAQCGVGSFDKGCLNLTTTNANWASQLRYAIPDLRDKLRKEAGLYQLSSIKISIIDPINQYEHPEKNAHHPLSEQAKATLICESENCAYQPLKRALLHLAVGELMDETDR